MPAPTTLPVWATDQQSLIVTPTLAKQQQGWTTDTNTPQGQGEKPPLQYFNWYQNLVYQWIQYLSQTVGNLPNFGTMAQQNANAIAVTGGLMDGVTIGGTTPAPAVFTKAVDNGAAPTLPAQITNKAYVDGSNVLSQTGYKTHPGGYIEQWTTLTIPAAQLTKSASIPNLDYWTLPLSEYVEFNFPIPFPNQLLGCHAYVLQSPFSGSNLGPNVYSEGGATTTQTKVLFVEPVATGVTPNQNLIISVKVWGD